jgi:benzoate/toluate 1,2-dioxygenase beta subunit
MSRLADAAEFVALEADLLDNRQFRDWLGLFMPEALYWVPVSPGQVDPDAAPSHLYEIRPLIDARVERLMAAKVIPQLPPSRTVRLVGPVRLVQDDAALFRVRAKFILVEARILHEADDDDEQRVIAGESTYDLVETAAGLRMARKRVDLVNSEGGLRGLSVPL